MPTDFKGTIKVKTPVNTSRYGQGDIECDNSLVLKEIVTPSNPAATYNKIYVDNTSKLLRIRDSAGVPRNVGVMREQMIINVNVTTVATTATQSISRFLLNGSSKNGIPKLFRILYLSPASTNLYIRMQIITPSTPATYIIGPTPTNLAITPSATDPRILDITTFTNYAANDIGVLLLASRGAGAGTHTILSVLFEW